MKSLFLALILFASISVQADVKRHGTLVPYLCAQTVTSDSGVEGVCFSFRVGEAGDWLVLTVSENRRQQIALPVASVTPGKSGKSIIVTVRVEGDIMVPLRGLGTSENIKSLYGDILGTHDFRASDFENVYTTASIR